MPLNQFTLIACGESQFNTTVTTGCHAGEKIPVITLTQTLMNLKLIASTKGAATGDDCIDDL